jgi:hypothetical protein
VYSGATGAGAEAEGRERTSSGRTP